MTLPCPFCAAATEAGANACSICGRSLSPLASAVASPAPLSPTPDSGAPALGKGARRDERFELPTDLLLRKVGPDGVPEKEERTIAHDLSRSGMRVLTSWSDLAEGDQVSVQEVGGNFSTGAIVRHVRRGTDQITRAGIEFVENRAPDRLVGTTTSIRRPVFSTVQRSAVPPGGTSASLPPPRASSQIPRLGTSASQSRPATTGWIPRPAVAPNPTSPVPPREAGGQPSGAPVAAGRSAENVLEEIAAVRATARGLIGESKIWEALECLSKAQALAEGTPEAKAVRILTWETQAKVPSLMRAAQQNLEDLARSEPGDVAAHSALGRMFFGKGLAARARLAFQQVLALDPKNREATAALAALSDPAKRR